MKKSIGLSLVVALITVACATVPIPDTSQLELHKAEIKTIAVLPLVLGDGQQKLEVGPGAAEDVSGLVAYWKDNFNAVFKTRLKLLEGIQVKYSGEDFVKAVPVDCGQLADELGVDAVLGFNLVRYNETTTASTLVKSLFGQREYSFAEIRLHFYYLHRQDWSPDLDYSEMTAPLGIGAGQRAWVVNSVVQWLDQNWPLSVDFKRNPETKTK